MAWSEYMLDASFRGVRFDVIQTRDSVSRSVAVHEYPYQDGGDVEDLGRQPRNSRMTALFWGDTYEQQLQTFIVALDTYGSAELMHPIFGSMPNMQCIEYGIDHTADNVDHCYVELVFLEATPGNPFFMQEFTLSKLDEILNKIQGLLDGLQGILDAVIAPLKIAQKYMAKIKALGSVMVNMVTVFRGDIVGFISSVKDFINYPGAFLSDLRSALDLTSLSSKSSTTNSITAYSDNTISDWKETKSQLNAIAAIPNAMITGETDAPVSMPAGATLDDIKELNAIVTAEVAAELTKNAIEILTDKEQLEKLSPDDIELIVNDVRESLQNVIDQHRELYEPEMQSVSSSPTDIALRWQPVVLSLKDIALDVQNLGNAAIMARPPLVRRRIESDCNFHLLAHKLYGDYQRAAELYRLNPTIRDSNNIKQGDFIYAYAR